MPIVAARPVNYGAIDPTVSREIFIQSALVEGDWNTKHKFFKENQRLVSRSGRVGTQKSPPRYFGGRSHAFEFYDQRIGTEVVSQKHFDTWWKKAQQKDPELLNFERSFLINDDAEQVSKLDFPEFLASRQFETQTDVSI